MDLNVAIYQPRIAPYRLALFKRIASYDNVKLVVCSSGTMYESNKDLSSTLGCDVTFGRTFNFLRKKFHWQTNFNIPKHFKKGDVVIIPGNPRYLNNFKIILLAKLKGLKIIIWTQWHSNGPLRFSQTLRRLMLVFADLVVLYSDEEVDQISQSNYKKIKCLSINNTIDTETVSSEILYWSTHRLSAFMKDRNLSLEFSYILFCGRITIKTNLDILIESVGMLRYGNKKIKLIIIGDGPKKAEYSELASKLNLDNEIIWVKGSYSERELAPWFLISNLLVYPGSVGLSLIHGMAYGLPVITHNDPLYQNPEFSALRNGFNGLTFNRGCVNDLSNTIEIAVNNSDLLSSLGSNASALVEQKYTINNMAENFLSAILEVSDNKVTEKVVIK